MATGKKVLVNSKIKRYTSLAELEKEDKGQVFVMNASTGDLSGQILISVPKKNGNGSDLVRVPKTFIPIDLSSQVPRSQLMESSEFRKSVTSGLLKLVTAEYATVLLNSEEGKHEKRRIENEMQKARTVLNNAGVAEQEDESDDDDENYVDPETVGREAKKAAQKAAAGKDKVGIKLQTLVNSATEDDLTQKEIVGKLLNYNNGDLTMLELDYLRKKYNDKPHVMKHLKSVYTARKAA